MDGISDSVFSVFLKFAENYDHPLIGARLILKILEYRMPSLSREIVGNPLIDASREMISKLDEAFKNKRVFFEQQKAHAFFMEHNIQINDLDTMDDIQKCWILRFEKQLKERKEEIELNCLIPFVFLFFSPNLFWA